MGNTLEKEFKAQADLNEVDFSRRELTNIPPAIAKLKKCTKLNLSENEITAIPLEIGKIRTFYFQCCSSKKKKKKTYNSIFQIL